MTLDIFETFGINGQTLKFLVDRDANNRLSLVTQTTIGSVAINNFPTTQAVSGTLAVSNFPSTQAVSGTLAVSNLPVDFIESTNTVSVTTAATTLITVDTRNFNYLSFEVTNGLTALTSCQIQARYHSSSTVWNPKTFGATEYTTGAGKNSGNSLISIIEASGNLNILSASTSGWVEINCSRYESVRLVATVASGTSSVITRAITKLR